MGNTLGMWGFGEKVGGRWVDVWCHEVQEGYTGYVGELLWFGGLAVGYLRFWDRSQGFGGSFLWFFWIVLEAMCQG